MAERIINEKRDKGAAADGHEGLSKNKQQFELIDHENLSTSKENYRRVVEERERDRGVKRVHPKGPSLNWIELEK